MVYNIIIQIGHSKMNGFKWTKLKFGYK